MDLVTVELNLKLANAVGKAPVEWPIGGTRKIMAFVWMMFNDPTRLALAPLVVSEMFYETIWHWAIGVEQYQRTMNRLEPEYVYKELANVYQELSTAIHTFCIAHNVMIMPNTLDKYHLVSRAWITVNRLRNGEIFATIRRLCVYGWGVKEQSLVHYRIDPHHPVYRAGSLSSNPMRRALEFL
jgi:hypothetical protein